MKREEFISTITIGASALCMGCFLACSKADQQQPQPEDKDVILKIDLTNNLTEIGQSKNDKGILVVRLGVGKEVYNFRAVEAACSFTGDNIQFNKQTNRFSCPNHVSIFDTEGRLLSGNAGANLKMFVVKISGNDLLIYGPGSIEPLSEPVNFNIDLNTDIRNIGDFKRIKDVLVLRIAAANITDSFVALSSVCTHQGSTIDYKPTQNQFVCPTHGSTYSLNGDVVRGPAPKALKKYKVSILMNILNVSEG